ncbi:MAG: pyridoxal-dependent decarboxylase [Bacteroidia bacterium]|nr:pyridoxal-dependent decarboxylase [Bacteroidia bacterium]
MIDRKDFKKHVPQVIDWIQNYFDQLEDLPVKSKVQPKDIYKQIPASMPAQSESLEDMLKDLEEIILPGVTHWQHPNFHAYFPANSSVESLYAEFITSAIAAQCMIWDTSPAAAELEERMMEWLREAMAIPTTFEGVIQDTASTASLVAILTAREVSTDFQSNEEGVPNNLRIYCSSETHSSIEKGVVIAGIGRKNLKKIAVDEKMAMIPAELEKQIQEDIAAGFKPCCVIAAIGTTGTVAVDPLKEIAAICKKYEVWLHVDAAYAGSALLLPEYHWMIEGIEDADSFVFNPHKWLFTNFDCTVYFVKDVEVLLKTFEILPEYLKTRTRGLVNDYRDWGVPLGRRFRALKLWFVMRGFGLEGIQQKLRSQLELNQYFAEEIRKSDSFELLLEPFLNFSCFRYKGEEGMSAEELDTVNARLLEIINDSGKLFVSHTKIKGSYVYRMVIGQTYIEKRHVDHALEVFNEALKSL